MAKQLEQFYDCPDNYMPMQEHKMCENAYELSAVYKKEEKMPPQSPFPPHPEALEFKRKQQTTWSKPLLFNTVLLCIILIIMIVVLGIVGLVAYDSYIVNSASNCRNAVAGMNTVTAGAGKSNDTKEWADHIVQNISQKFPNFTEWAEMIVQNVYQEIVNNGQNFTELTDVLIHNINTAVNESLPNFNEWANGVVNKVNTNVTQSLPNFNEWANGVINKVNTNVTQSLPNFNEWANGVVNKVNTNVTQSLPNFNEWANGVIHNINTNVTRSFPIWTEDVVHKVTTNVTQSIPKFTAVDSQILQSTSTSAQRLSNIINTLSNLQGTSSSTAGEVDNTLSATKELLSLIRNAPFVLPTSCNQIKNQRPSAGSGNYILARTHGSENYTTYCNMNNLCGSGGGWTRLAYLDMSDSTQSCPSGFSLYQSGGVRACGRPESYGSCVSVKFPSNGISYSQVCGRVVGYQYGHTDAVSDYHNNINSYYVEGVSITRGSPRQHVWTLMAGYTEANAGSSECPCNTGSTVSVVPFIGNNYFCESGNTASGTSSILYTSDPLWDGYNCRSYEAPCCTAAGPPWFHRDYGTSTTTDYIELRVCGDVGNSEDSPVSFYEIYVK